MDKENVKRLISDMGAHDCVECGKCTTVCPITRFNPEFAPRLVVVKALAGEDMDLSKDSDIWACNTCELCNNMCPYEVDYSGFIRGMRGEAYQEGHEPDCSQGGLLHTMMRIMANSDLPQNRLDWITDDLRVAEKGDVFLFVGCSPQLDTIFEDRDLNLTETARSAIRIMNHMGIEPIVSAKEKCCGHDLNWCGDEKNLIKLMNHNVRVIKDSGAKTVVFTCPECMRTFDLDYQDFLGDFDFEMLHISEFIANAIEEGKLKFPEDLDLSVTFHDSCRLGRHLDIYDQPREVISRIPSVKLIELEKNKEASTCCGVSGFMNCSSISKVMQMEKMQDAKKTGAHLLITPCPKCLIHLDCSTRNETPVDKELIDIPIMDFTNFVAQALRGEVKIPEVEGMEEAKEDDGTEQRGRIDEEISSH
jgi:Fe-S oxidoreductase